MHIQLLLIFAVLFISAKLMSLRLPFYSAALLAVAGLYVVQSISTVNGFGPILTPENGVRLAIALVLFYFLDKAEDTLGRWLFIFTVTFVVFAYIL